MTKIYNNQKDIRQEEEKAKQAIYAMAEKAKERFKEKAETILSMVESGRLTVTDVKLDEEE